VTLTSPSDIVDKAAYVLANPVAAGLVRSGSLWPGVWSDPARIGAEPVELERPRHFFDTKGSLPAKVELELTAPPGFASASDFRKQVIAALEAREEQAVRSNQRGFLGAVRVLRQKPTARPASPEPRRNLSPRVAAKDPWKRIEALGRMTEFLRSYRAAWNARRAGETDVVFPLGTYLLRVAHGVPCAGFS
jgi:hypothetical protein